MADDLVLHATLRDELTTPLRGVRREIDATARAARGADPAARAGARGFDLLGRSGSGASRSVGDLHTRLMGMSRDLGGAVSTAARRGATALVALGGAATYFGLRSASQFQTSEIAFQTLLGSVERGTKLFADLQAINLKTPFGLTELTNSAQMLLSYGLSAEKLTSSLEGLVDVASLTGKGAEGLNRLSLAFGQVVSMGRLTGQEARQFAEAGVNVYELYADKLGLSIAETRKLGEAGELSADVLVDAFARMEGPLAKFAGGAEKANQTLLGQWSNLKDQLAVRLANAADPLVNQFTSTMPQIVEMVGGLVDQVGPPFFGLLGTLATGVTRLLPVISGPLEALTSGVGRLLDAAGPGLTALVPLGDAISKSIGSLVDELVPVMPDLVDLFVALVGVAPEFVELLGAMVPLVTPVARLATELLGFEPVQTVLAGTLGVLLGYRAVAGLVGGLNAFAGALGFVGREAATAGTAAATAQGPLGRLGRTGGGLLAAGGLLATGAQAADRLKDPNPKSVGADLAFVGGGALTGAAIGSIVPVVGTGVGALAGGAVAGGIALADRFFGDPFMAGPAAAGHERASTLAGGGAGRRVTSGLRSFGVRGADSKHLTGMAVDVAGSGLAGYARAVNAIGGRAKIHDGGSGEHVHAEFGDIPMAAHRGGRLPVAMGAPTIVFTGAINGVKDLKAAVRAAWAEIQRNEAERARRPLRARDEWVG